MTEKVKPLIELIDIYKTYKRPTGEPVEALSDVSIHVKRGEFLAIVGQSGSGKSTLMNILGLLDLPTQGRYLLDGQDVTTLDANRQAEMRNRKIGFVFQSFHLLPRTTALENVELPLLYSDRKSIKDLSRKALASVGLSDRIHHRPSELSGGQQQRVAIARALVNEPDLLLADEPTGNLDRQSAQEILSIFLSLNRTGRTLVLITHDSEIASYADRVVRLERGYLMADDGIVVAGTQERTARGAK